MFGLPISGTSPDGLLNQLASACPSPVPYHCRPLGFQRVLRTYFSNLSEISMLFVHTIENVAAQIQVHLYVFTYINMYS